MSDERILEPRAAGARRFAGKVCVIAGGGQGIGSATARRMAQEGGILVLGDWVEASARKVCDEAVAFGGQATVHVGNYAEWDACQSLMAHTIATYGRIDVLVVIVGGTIFFQSFQYYTPEQIVAEMDKSLWPAVWCVRAALPYMIERTSGSIVTLSSHAIVGKFRAPYSVAKAGIVGLTSSLSKEISQYGIRINSIAPSAAAAGDRVTPRNYRVDAPASELPPEERELQRRYREAGRRSTQPLAEFLGRDSTAEEQAAAIAFLASDDASFITGEVISVGGGETFPF
jgi:NAD(P)-dependent dehydrogenase (short-subunit alcohol dehydrogenase family)